MEREVRPIERGDRVLMIDLYKGEGIIMNPDNVFHAEPFSSPYRIVDPHGQVIPDRQYRKAGQRPFHNKLHIESQRRIAAIIKRPIHGFYNKARRRPGITAVRQTAGVYRSDAFYLSEIKLELTAGIDGMSI